MDYDYESLNYVLYYTMVSHEKNSKNCFLYLHAHNGLIHQELITLIFFILRAFPTIPTKLARFINLVLSDYSGDPWGNAQKTEIPPRIGDFIEIGKKKNDN